jgi:hypothetical protein
VTAYSVLLCPSAEERYRCPRYLRWQFFRLATRSRLSGRHPDEVWIALLPFRVMPGVSRPRVDRARRCPLLFPETVGRRMRMVFISPGGDGLGQDHKKTACSGNYGETAGTSEQARSTKETGLIGLNLREVGL